MKFFYENSPILMSNSDNIYDTIKTLIWDENTTVEHLTTQRSLFLDFANAIKENYASIRNPEYFETVNALSNVFSEYFASIQHSDSTREKLSAVIDHTLSQAGEYDKGMIALAYGKMLIGIPSEEYFVKSLADLEKRHGPFYVHYTNGFSSKWVANFLAVLKSNQLSPEQKSAVKEAISILFVVGENIEISLDFLEPNIRRKYGSEYGSWQDNIVAFQKDLRATMGEHYPPVLSTRHPYDDSCSPTTELIRAHLRMKPNWNTLRMLCEHIPVDI